MSDHARARRLVPAYRLGLLAEAEAQELRAHLRECAECRALFEEFLAPTSDEETRAGHLPLGVITRWDTLPLADGERALIEEHFAACDACREAREFARTIRAARRPARPRLSWKWLGFGTAALAAVLAAIVVPARRPAPHRGPASTTAEAIRETPTAPAPAVRAPTLALGNLDRGAPAPFVVVPRGTAVLPIRVPPLLGVGPQARIVVRVLGPGSEELGHASIRHAALFGTGDAPTLEARSSSGTLADGHYRVEVGSDAPDPQVPGSFEHVVYDFDLRFAE